MTSVVVPAEHTSCRRCGSQLAPALLACPACQTLVHADRLTALAAEAQHAESSGEATKALQLWREAIALLPDSSPQHGVIATRIATLAKGASDVERSARHADAERVRAKWSKGRLGGILGPIAVLLFKFKFVVVLLLTKAKLLLFGFTKLGSLLSMLATMGLYWTVWGWPFAVGFVLAIYVHEIGHVSALARYGIKASAPMFIPGIAAFVRGQAPLHGDRENAIVALAGPLWGLLAAVGAYGLYFATGSPVLAAIAHAAAVLNILNLLPAWPLDGSSGFAAMSRTHRLVAAGALFAAAAVTHERLLVLVGGVAAVMAFVKPSRQPDARIAMYYVALVAALAGTSWLAMTAAAPHALR